MCVPLMLEYMLVSLLRPQADVRCLPLSCFHQIFWSLSFSLIWEVKDSLGFRDLPKSTFPVLCYINFPCMGWASKLNSSCQATTILALSQLQGPRRQNFLHYLSSIWSLQLIHRSNHEWCGDQWICLGLHETVFIEVDNADWQGGLRIALRVARLKHIGFIPLQFFFNFGGLDFYFSFLYLTM